MLRLCFATLSGADNCYIPLDLLALRRFFDSFKKTSRFSKIKIVGPFATNSCEFVLFRVDSWFQLFPDTTNFTKHTNGHELCGSAALREIRGRATASHVVYLTQARAFRPYSRAGFCKRTQSLSLPVLTGIAGFCKDPRSTRPQIEEPARYLGWF